MEQLRDQFIGELVTTIEGHGPAFLVEKRHEDGYQYLVTPDTGHIWMDTGASRCSDMGQITCPTMPEDEAPDDEWLAWAEAVREAADAAGVSMN